MSGRVTQCWQRVAFAGIQSQGVRTMLNHVLVICALTLGACADARPTLRPITAMDPGEQARAWTCLAQAEAAAAAAGAYQFQSLLSVASGEEARYRVYVSCMMGAGVVPFGTRP